MINQLCYIVPVMLLNRCILESFTERQVAVMAVDNKFLIRKIKGLAKAYVMFSRVTVLHGGKCKRHGAEVFGKGLSDLWRDL